MTQNSSEVRLPGAEGIFDLRRPPAASGIGRSTLYRELQDGRSRASSAETRLIPAPPGCLARRRAATNDTPQKEPR